MLHEVNVLALYEQENETVEIMMIFIFWIFRSSFAVTVRERRRRKEQQEREREKEREREGRTETEENGTDTRCASGASQRFEHVCVFCRRYVSILWEVSTRTPRVSGSLSIVLRR